MTVHPAGTREQGPVPDRHRVLGVLARRSEVAPAEHAHRAGARLRDRRHQHPRHRLFGGAFNFFEQLPVDRRLRRGRDDRGAAVGRVPQGRTGRPLVPGDQPAVRRAVAPAAPGRDRAVVGDRRHDQEARSLPAASSTPGFAVAWAKDRQHDAAAAPGGGQSWATDRIKAGDTDVSREPGACTARRPTSSTTIKTERLLDRRDRPAALARALREPDQRADVSLAGDWQDEQTGGYFANLFASVHRDDPTRG